MSDNENVVSFELDTTKIDKSIDKLKEALPKGFDKQIERIKKSVESLNKQNQALIDKQVKAQAKEQEKAQKELQKQLIQQEKEKAKEQLRLQKELLLAKSKEQEKEIKEKAKQQRQELREQQKQKEQELKAKHKEALLDKEKEYRFKSVKEEVKKDRQELRARIRAKTTLKPQGNQYTKSISDLQEQYKALTNEYATLDSKDPQALKEEIKKQQENLNYQAYNIKQARLQNQSTHLSAEQKRANKDAINKQVELYNKQRQNTIKNAMNLDKSANNIKDMATNIEKQKSTFSLLKDAIKEIGIGKITLVATIGKIISLFNQYENLKYTIMGTQKYANASKMTLNEARVIQQVSNQNNDAQLMQVMSVMGNLQDEQTLNNVALAMVGLNRKKLLKLNVFERFKSLTDAYKNKMGELVKKGDHETIGVINRMITQDLGVSLQYLKEITSATNKDGIDFSRYYYDQMKDHEKYVKAQKDQIANTKIFETTHQADIKGGEKELQKQQSALFKLDSLAKVNQTTNDLLANLNSVITSIYALIDRYLNGNGIFYHNNISNPFNSSPFNSHNQIFLNDITPSNLNKSMIMTNKANQGGEQ